MGYTKRGNPRGDHPTTTHHLEMINMRKHLTRLGMGVITAITLMISCTPTPSTTTLTLCDQTTTVDCVRVEEVDDQGNGWGYLISHQGEPLTPANFWNHGDTIELY